MLINIYINGIEKYDFDVGVELQKLPEKYTSLVFHISYPDDNNVKLVDKENIKYYRGWCEPNFFSTSDHSILIIKYKDEKPSMSKIMLDRKINPLNKFFSIFEGKRKLNDILEDFKNNKLETPSNIYFGNKISFTDKYLTEAYYVMALSAKHYCDAGFDKLKVTKRLDDWLISLNEPAIRGFISFYGLYPEDRIYDDATKFCYSPQYRQVITQTLKKVVIRAAVVNKLIERDNAQDEDVLDVILKEFRNKLKIKN